MTILIRAVFYHRKSQLPRIIQIASEMEPGSTLHVLTSPSGAVSLRNAISDSGKSHCIFEEKEECIGDSHLIRLRDVSIDIKGCSDEKELTYHLTREYYKAAGDSGIDSGVLEVDMTYANPWESVAICKLSSALNVKMYTQQGPSRQKISSFPRLVILDDQELAIVDEEYSSTNFTATDAIDDLKKNNLKSSNSTTQRVIGRLVTKGFIKELRDYEYPGPRSNHGGNREKYYRSVDESWMMYRINRRKVEKIKDSMHDAISDTDDNQESN